MEKVTCITVAYNAEKTIHQAVESVLAQTYGAFEYIIVDHGSTDGTQQIIREYEKMDVRIHGVYEDKNHGSGKVLPLIIRQAKRICDKWLAILDADDWWDSDYLARLLSFQAQNRLDIAMTGTINDFEETGVSRIMRKLEEPVVLAKSQFVQLYPQLWVYPSTVWGSLLRVDLFRNLDERNSEGDYGDTRLMLRYLDQCQRIGIDNSTLYHYRIWASMSFNKYKQGRFDANVAYYEDIRDFLKKNHGLDTAKQEWLKLLHLSSMLQTLALLHGSTLPHKEKLAECHRIAAHPLTAIVLTGQFKERDQWVESQRMLVYTALNSGEEVNVDDARAILTVVSPQCAAAITGDTLPVFRKEIPMQRALLYNDWDGLVETVMRLIVQKKYSKQCNFGQLLHNLIPENSPLKEISDAHFFRVYAEICLMVLCENRIGALDAMTGLLLDGKRLYAEEHFLSLYLSLAALENQAPAFLFGKEHTARFLFQEGRMEECRTVLTELTEMGVEDTEDIASFRQLLERF